MSLIYMNSCLLFPCLPSFPPPWKIPHLSSISQELSSSSESLDRSFCSVSGRVFRLSFPPPQWLDRLLPIPSFFSPPLVILLLIFPLSLAALPLSRPGEAPPSSESNPICQILRHQDTLLAGLWHIDRSRCHAPLLLVHRREPAKPF